MKKLHGLGHGSRKCFHLLFISNREEKVERKLHNNEDGCDQIHEATSLCRSEYMKDTSPAATLSSSVYLVVWFRS